MAAGAGAERRQGVTEGTDPDQAEGATVSRRRSAVGVGAWTRRLARLALFVVSLGLFVLALELMKAGAAGTATLLGQFLEIDNVPNALGFGWFATYLVLSGSPVAAVSVTFLATGVLQKLSAYAMITGSRLGASFIVLFIGFVYVLRGQERRSGLAMGLLSLVVTASIYLPALVLGLLLLQHGLFDRVRLTEPVALGSALDRVVAPVVHGLSSFLPGWGVMLAGLAVLWVSFWLFDRVLPELRLEETRFGQVAHLVYRPLIMFFLGSLLTLVTLSVSLSLSLLVPLSARGYVRRENAVPYIMGANITTFVDTLLATVVLASSDAFTVVLVSMTSVSLLSVLVLLLISRPYERAVLATVQWSLATNRNLVFFMGIILAVPLLLLLI